MFSIFYLIDKNRSFSPKEGGFGMSNINLRGVISCIFYLKKRDKLSLCPSKVNSITTTPETYARKSTAHFSAPMQKILFMDSAGLGIIIGRYKNVLATGGKTFVSAPSGHTRRLLTLAGMNKIIPLCKNLDEALGGAAK